MASPENGAAAGADAPQQSPPRPSTVPRGDIARAALLLASGLVGWFGEEPKLATLVWLALWAPAAGFLAGRWRPGAFLLTPVGWMLVLGLGLFDGAERVGAGVSVAGLFYAGNSLGSLISLRRPPAAGWAGAALLLFATGALAALPSLGGALARPFAPELTATLLELSPVVWVAESAGFDWMRHPSVYELAGAADIGPDLRLARTWGSGAALACVVLAAASWLLGRRAFLARG